MGLLFTVREKVPAAPKEPKVLFTAEDRSNPPRCFAKLLGYLILSPCIITYMLAQTLGKCMWHFCACIDRICELSAMCIERLCRGLAMIQAACCRAICKGLELLYRYTIGALLHAIYDYIMVPTYTYILFPICRLLWRCAASFVDTVSTVCRVLYNNVLMPVYRAMACVASAIASAARALGRFIYNFWIAPLKYAVSSCCSCIWRGMKAAGNVLYKYIFQPIYSMLYFVGKLVRDYIIRPIHYVVDILILTPGRCLLRGLRKLCAGLWWGIVMLVTYLIINPAKLIYTHILLPPVRLVGQGLSIILRVVGAIFDAIRTAVTTLLRAIASIFR